jgi:flagellar basal body-associated protein FliL
LGKGGSNENYPEECWKIKAIIIPLLLTIIIIVILLLLLLVVVVVVVVVFKFMDIIQLSVFISYNIFELFVLYDYNNNNQPKTFQTVTDKGSLYSKDFN